MESIFWAVLLTISFSISCLSTYVTINDNEYIDHPILRYLICDLFDFDDMFLSIITFMLVNIIVLVVVIIFLLALAITYGLIIIPIVGFGYLLLKKGVK